MPPSNHHRRRKFRRSFNRGSTMRCAALGIATGGTTNRRAGALSRLCGHRRRKSVVTIRAEQAGQRRSLTVARARARRRWSCAGGDATVDGRGVSRISGCPTAMGRASASNAGNLHVTRTTFRNSEQGILTGRWRRDGDDRAIRPFRGWADATHRAGVRIRSISGVTASWSCHAAASSVGTGGHYVKSRARENEIVDSSFDDSGGRATNYMIDLPAGSTGLIARNMPSCRAWTRTTDRH